MGRTPLILVTGYLGAGKTTFLRHVLDNADRRIAVVMNEFGEENIDADIIERDTFQVAELENGCVCCALTGAFTDAVKTLSEEYEPVLIIVETSGVAEPDNVVMLVEELDHVFLDSVVAVADAAALHRFDNLGHTGRIQLDLADVILLNKTNLVDEEDIQDVEGQVRAVNGDAPIFHTVKAAVDLEKVLGFGETVRDLQEPHTHEQRETFLHWNGDTVELEALQAVLDDAPEDVYRVKGFAHTKKGTFLVQYAFGHTTIEEWDEAQGMEGTRLVVIGDLTQTRKEELRQQFNTCEVE